MCPDMKKVSHIFGHADGSVHHPYHVGLAGSIPVMSMYNKNRPNGRFCNVEVRPESLYLMHSKQKAR